MKISKNTRKLQKTKYLSSRAKSKMESKDKCGAHRVATAIESGETNVFEYGSLERILYDKIPQVISKKGETCCIH